MLFSRTPCLHTQDAETLRKRVRDYFVDTFDTYESLFETLADDQAFYTKPISLRHPLIFYYGHTATFFINKLMLARLIDTRVDPRFESLFAVGVDEMSWDDLDDTHYAWPPVAEVKAYRDQVRALVLRVIDETPLVPPIDWQHPWWALLMGIEHERIHLETSSVLIRQHHLARVKPHPRWRPWSLTGDAPINQLVPVPAGHVSLGKPFQDAYYGWDNEYGARETDVAGFQASRYLVSNAEFLEFVQERGYEREECWQAEGKSWRDFARAQHPSFWVWSADGWRLRLMTDEIPMPWDWPVEVNYHEAKAFCEWKKSVTGLPIRLPTEEEWYRLYDHAGVQEVPPDSPVQANLHLDHSASPCPVNHFAQGGFYDVVGNVWQWTETPMYPLVGFEVHPLYDDFTTPTFDQRHNLIKGGSWISCGNESRRSARYAFRRHFFQHAGFRYLVGEEPRAVPDSQYETDKLMAEYAEFHYGDTYFGVPNFSRALVELALPFLNHNPKRQALDIGCASGRASFELAKYFDAVTGVDFSARFIQQGVQLLQDGHLRYTLTEEGELVTYKTRRLDELGLAETASRVTFYQGDACNLKAQFSGYDFILAANLIDRLYHPEKFLRSLRDRLNPGGLLLLASPYTWLEDHTPRADWLGGFKRDGENFTTLDGLKAILGADFRLLADPQQVPFVIRETRRKYQHSLSEATVWERVS